MQARSWSRWVTVAGLLLAAAAIAAAAEPSAPLRAAAEPPTTAPMKRELHVKPRYHRWHVDPGEEWLETNTGYATLDWRVPVNQAALVLVDVWDHHYLKEPHERADRIIRERLAPLVRACRNARIQVIHAPAPELAKKEAAWLHATDNASSTPAASWPPKEFREKTDAYAAFARPKEPRQAEIDRCVETQALHPLVRPEGNDVVVATGEELHRYCAQKGILFLFYAGFNTNACILMRDYGTVHMSERGYDIIILRDCTTGMESPETQGDLFQTRGAILFLEMFGKYSLTSDEMIAGMQ